MAPKQSKPPESIREKLCSAIALLDPNATRNECADHLGNIFDEYLQSNLTKGNDGGGSNITPLIVACDKLHHAAMGFLKNQLLCTVSVRENTEMKKTCETNNPTLTIKQLVEVWGHPTETSSLSEGGNSPSHHALMVGFHDGIAILEKFWECIAESEAKHILSNSTSDCTSLVSNEKSEIFADENTRSPKTKPYRFPYREGHLPRSSFERYFCLISQRNRNRDTPIMMACVSGHESSLHFILSRMVSLAWVGSEISSHGEVINMKWRALQQLFAMENADNVTSLKLACGHGHVSTVKFLIQSHHLYNSHSAPSVKVENPANIDNGDSCSGLEAHGEQNERTIVMKPLVIVKYGDIEFCKSAIKSIYEGLKKIATKNIAQVHLEEYTKRRKQILSCLAMLDVEISRIVTIAASEILNDADELDNTVCEANARKKRNKKKRGKRKNKHSSTIHPVFSVDSKFLEPGEDAGRNKSSKAWAQHRDLEMIDVSSTPFITLEDGRLISRSQLKSNALSIPDIADCCEVAETPIPAEPVPESIQSILESRYRQQKNLQTATKSGLSDLGNNKSDSHRMRSGNEENSETCTSLEPGSIEAKMESLCLDPSMLLLSPHGMAMGMSPCQLDAIESILKHQLIATNEARRIQDRLLTSDGKGNNI
ncbi:hypothetical protein ACHAXS_010744 [Conticribra weissflogii]